MQIKDHGQTLDSLTNVNQYGSQALLPLIIKILQKNNLQLSNLTEIEVETGPGSFTGLRVGASVAQALGFALNIPVNAEVHKPLNLRYTEKSNAQR